MDLHRDLQRFEDSRPVYARIRQTGRDWSGRAALAAAHGATETPHTLRPPEARGQACPYELGTRVASHYRCNNVSRELPGSMHYALCTMHSVPPEDAEILLHRLLHRHDRRAEQLRHVVAG